MGFLFLAYTHTMNNYVEKLYGLFLEQRKISTDSRNISSGDIFFALKGDSFNGNVFALDALKQGARLVLLMIYS